MKKMFKRNKPLKLLFDATIIVENIKSNTSGRSGIFWVAYNILRQFGKNPLYKLTLLVPQKTVIGKENELMIFLSSFPSISIYERDIYETNINVHKDQIKNTKNIFIIGFRYLQILKNIIILFVLKVFFNNLNYDVYFSPLHSISDTIKNNFSINFFHILYDCIPILEIFSSISDMISSSWFSQLIQNLNRETYYFCISECTKNDFLRLFPYQLDESRMFITPISTSQNFFPNYNKIYLHNIFKKYGITFKQGDLYMFTLCNIDPRKNLIFTIKCFLEFIRKHNINNFYFLLGGASFFGYYEKFLNEISNFAGYQDKIIQLGYVDDEDVNVLYSNSLFFTFLSQYEGFGIPPLEAMQAGTPVICSNNSSLPEVVGDAAITITYNDEEACIKAFEDLYFNEDLRKYYIEKGLERSKLFSWEKTFNIMSKIIIDVINTKSMK